MSNIVLGLRAWIARLIASLTGRRRDEDLERELRLHRELAAEAAQRHGATADDAARQATLDVGSIAQAMDSLRDQRGLPWLEDLSRDLRYAVRTLLRARVFTLAVVLSLALGIGGNTAIFTLMDAVLFRTIPIAQPDRLFFLGHDSGPQLDLSANYPIFERYRAAPVFSGVTAYRSRTFKLRTSDSIVQVPGQYVSGNYHAVIGVPMALGRGFSAEPDRRAGASLLAVISYDYWMTRFGGDPAVIGKTLDLDDRTVAIIGVTAKGFHGLNAGGRMEVTLPLSVMVASEPRFLNANDSWTNFTIVARLASGVSEAQAAVATETVFQQFIQEPANGWINVPDRRTFRTSALVPAARGTFSLRREYGRPLWILLAMVAVLLLIACTNVAVLLLARSTDRGREIAVRLGIGASRSRLVRQMLTESAVLALLGGGAGVAVAIWGTTFILSVFATGPSPLAIYAGINARVLFVTMAVICITAIGVGLAPAVRATRVDLAPALKIGTPTVHSAPRQRLEKTLVVAQVALSLLLVAAAGLLSRSLHNLQRFDAGFTRDRLLLADIDLGSARLPGDQRLSTFAEVLDRLRALPGVQAASLSSRTPVDFSLQLRRIEVPGFEASPSNGVSPNTVTRGYFQTFGMEVIRGRDFTDDDRRDTARVAVISESTARHFFGDADPIGRTFVLGPHEHSTTIVGVVTDARHERLRTETPARMVYLPLFQPSAGLDGSVNAPNRLAVALRTSDDPVLVASLIRGEVSAIRKDAMVLYVRTMAQQIDATLVPERLLTTLSRSFAAVALLLSCVGLYGVMAYNVSRRTRELGVRLALGALPRTLVYGVLRDVFVVSAIGIVFGVPLTLAMTGLLSPFLFGLTPRDTPTLVGTTAVILAVALVAGALPARKAAGLDPVGVIREQ
jgi:predicted permease